MKFYGQLVTQTAHDCCSECGRPLETPVKGLLFEGEFVSYGGHKAKLTFMQRKLLKALARRFGTTVHTDSLLSTVWGDDTDVDPKIVSVMICKMRQRLAHMPLEIKTAWGIGFSLCARDVGNVVRLNSTTSQEPSAHADRT
jgi:DNA-binding winged helix-turn-helix (wHTH) protein